MVSMLDDLRGYLQLATGLTEVTANRAKEAAMSLVGQGFSLSTKAPDVVGQVQELADDLVSTSKSNRELLVSMIRSEVDKAVGRMGFVREDELAALRRHVQRLEQQLDELRAQSRPAAEGKDSTDLGGEELPAPVVRKKKKVVVDPDAASPGAG
ncbi:MAG: polyhydroxyalkanoate synthesis protein PhaF [Actinobacteria bacterium]|uniref:Unannotated protein n=1 Tax=freshwater metagenome TaxID=449393 RepID=A0A6J7IIX9_9ZZZZ|nr:polyhydroxyalkanoate synthesis protein PhaF [Actinomycetota bacterium]